ncbi:MAG: ABC transporter substrate-binding protein [bacterium]
MQKYKISLVVIAILIFFLTGLSIYLNSQREETAVSSNKIMLEDSVGRKVDVVCPPQRIIALNTDAAELICALGEEKRIAAVTDGDKFPPVLNQKQKVGVFTAPSLEKILSLNPDLVIAYSGSVKSEALQQLSKSGVPVLLLDCYKLSSFKEDVRKLGKILQKEELAQEYLAAFDKYLKLIEDRVKQIPEEKRKRVYIESYSDYSTVSKSGAAQMVETAGGINIAGDMSKTYNQVSPEWVVTQNPDVIIKGAGSSIVSGYHKDDSSMKHAVDNIMRRVGWDKIQAVKTGNVFILSTDLWTGPRQLIGIIYIARWLYPDLFADLDPLKIHTEILEKYHHCDAKGAWAYPN